MSSGITELPCEPVEVSGQKWFPIDSAPINTSVLVFIPNTEHYGPGVYRALRPKFGTLRPWQVTGLHFGRDCYEGAQPTHWMPLPSVPGRSGEGGVAGPARPRIHNLKMLDAIQLVVLEYSNNKQLAESVRQWLSAEKGPLANSVEASGQNAATKMRDALIRLRDCDWVISLPDRMDAVRQIAREALEGIE